MKKFNKVAIAIAVSTVMALQSLPIGYAQDIFDVDSNESIFNEQQIGQQFLEEQTVWECDLIEDEQNVEETSLDQIIPAAESIYGEVTPEYDWYGDGTGAEFAISTAGQLLGLANIVNGTTGGTPAQDNFSTKTIFLADDIDLSGIPIWTPIGKSTPNENQFAGTFDGNNHRIENLTISGSGVHYQGLFAYINGGKIQSLGISGSISGPGNVGSIAGCVINTTITNCYNTASVSGNAGSVGGIVGSAKSNSTITNCYNTGAINGYNYYVGGIVGLAEEYVTIIDCHNTGDITGSSPYVGGIVGEANGIVQNCYNTGDITGSEDFIGGIAGYLYGNIENCHNIGNVYANNCAGGITGFADGYGGNAIKNCYNTGNITGTYTGETEIGGITGHATKTNIMECYNTGTVIGSGDYIGGIAALRIADGATIESCYNTGAVFGRDYLGGIIGFRYVTTSTPTDDFVKNCYNTGTINGNNYVGGMEGQTCGVVTNCYNIGAVIGNNYVGSITGNADDATIANSYYNSDTSIAMDSRATALTTRGMTGLGALQKMSGFDDNNWEVKADDKDNRRVFYPYLKSIEYDEAINPVPYENYYKVNLPTETQAYSVAEAPGYDKEFVVNNFRFIIELSEGYDDVVVKENGAIIKPIVTAGNIYTYELTGIAQDITVTADATVGPVNPANPEDPSNPGGSNTPETGDNTNVAMLMTIMIVAGGTLIAVRRKKKQ